MGCIMMIHMQDVELTAEDGTRLHSWMMWPKGWSKQRRRSRPTVLFFQAWTLAAPLAAFCLQPIKSLEPAFLQGPWTKWYQAHIKKHIAAGECW